jgi:transposase
MSRLTEKQRCQIREIFQRTGSIRKTAKQTSISRNAVRRQLRGHGGVHPAPACPPRPSKLDPYKAKIGYLVREKNLSAVRVMEEIAELGYQGGYSIVKGYVRTIRPRPQRRPTPPIDHPPGEEAQMDWSPHRVILGGTTQLVHTSSIVLCFSRWLFFRHFPDETLQSVIRLHEQAFKRLNAVPQTISYDNMTTVGRHIGPSEVWIHPAFQRFADSYGFKIVILPPGAKQRHGKVERPFHYIENNFLAGREFHDLEDLNTRADWWQTHTANVRIHGTLRERPVDRLQRERSYLNPLPQHRAALLYKQVDRLIHPDFCVAVDTNRYSANPNLIGQYAQVRLYDSHLEIWVNKQLDCKHTYIQDKHKRHVLPEHEQLYKHMTGQRQLLKTAFLRLGQPAIAYYEGLKKHRRAAAGYHLQRILTYAQRYGHDVLAGALAHAERYGAYSADAILRIIQGKRIKQNPVQTIPENVRQWLRSCAVEKQDPRVYDRMLQQDHENPEDEK